MITGREITKILKNELQPLPYVYELWLEGLFAMGHADADEYMNLSNIVPPNI